MKAIILLSFYTIEYLSIFAAHVMVQGNSECLELRTIFSLWFYEFSNKF